MGIVVLLEHFEPAAAAAAASSDVCETVHSSGRGLVNKLKQISSLPENKTCGCSVKSLFSHNYLFATAGGLEGEQEQKQAAAM